MAEGPAPIAVGGIAGSLREGSFNRALLRAARDLAPAGMEIRIFEGLRDIPLYDADLDASGPPAAVAALKDFISKSDALLFATPEYNYGIPGVLKNAIDWASRPASGSVMHHLPAAIMGASGGVSGTRRAHVHLRDVLVSTRNIVLPWPEVLVSEARTRFDAELRLTDETTRRLVGQLLGNLLDLGRRMRGYPSP